MTVSGEGLAVARRWAATLCLADGDVEARDVLNRAFADIGFESVAVVHRDRSCRVTTLWRFMEGREVTTGDALTAANHETLARLDPSAHRWVMRHTGVMTHLDFLAIDRGTYRDYLELPHAFGHAPWQTTLAVAHHAGDDCFSLGVASTSTYERRRGDSGQVRFLAGLYFALRTAGAPAPMDRARPLSRVQLDILRWAAAGKSYHDIADIVGVTPRAVRYHLEHARSRYGFATVMQTVVQAAKDYDFDPLLGRQ